MCVISMSINRSMSYYHCSRALSDTQFLFNLIIGSLKEGGIDSHHRLHPLCRQSRRKGHCMLFCDPHIIKPIREHIPEALQPGSVRHGRRHCHHPGILLCNPADLPGKYIRIAGVLLFLQRLTRSDVKGLHTMKGGRILLRRQGARAPEAGAARAVSRSHSACRVPPGWVYRVWACAP